MNRNLQKTRIKLYDAESGPAWYVDEGDGLVDGLPVQEPAVDTPHLYGGTQQGFACFNHQLAVAVAVYLRLVRRDFLQGRNGAGSPEFQFKTTGTGGDIVLEVVTIAFF